MLARLLPIALTLGACAHPTPSRPHVHSLDLRGVHNVSRRQLARGLAVAPAPCCFRAPRPYDELLLDADRLRIRRFYEAHGYYGAKVTLAEARPRANPSSLDVVIGIDEGGPTHIGDVRVYGLGDLDSDTKKRVDEQQLGLRRGQVFVHADYVLYKELMLGILKARGYAWARADGKVTVDPAHDMADIELTFSPGPIVSVSSIVFQGVGETVDENLVGITPASTFRLKRSAETAKKVSPRLIEQVLDLKAGGTFDMQKLEEARGRVLELGIFSSVGLAYDPDPKKPNAVNVTLRLADASLHELRLGGGLGIESQRNELHLLLQYTKRNFFGGLRTLELKLQPSYVVVPAIWTSISRHGPAGNLDLVFTQARLRTLSRLQATVGYDLGVEYGYQYHGPRAQVAVMKLLWHDRISLALSYNFQFLDFFHTAPEILADPTLAASRFGYLDPYRVAWLQQELHFDWRDSRVDPRRGMVAEIIVEEGGVYTGSAFTYEKLRLGQRGYLPLGKRVVLANRTEFAKMWSHGDEGSPITRRLSLGGPQSHRGFTEARLAPQLTSANGPPIPVGGELSYLISAEVRVDIIKLVGSMLAAAAFIDAGDVGAGRGDNATGFRQTPNFHAPHVALGAGLRYRTPVGVIRTDVGVRMNRVSATEDDGTPNPDPGQRVAFHISLAESF